MSNVNYSQMYNQTAETTTNAPSTTPEPEAPKDVIGVVVECKRLNVRKQPDIKSAVVCVIEADTEVKIDEAKSTDDFYRVLSTSDTKRFFGYCMRDYISIID